MTSRNKLILALALFGIAALLVWRFRSSGEGGGGSDLGFFYDESAKKLFTANRLLVPPIKGTDGPQEDAYRAVVISPTAQPKNKKTWEVAYLEKYSPELKAMMMDSQKQGTPLPISRMEALNHRFVRRLKETTWYPMSSPEAEQIVSEWANPGPNGVVPVACTP